MPELPEVETVTSELRTEIVGQRLMAVHVRWPGTIAEPDPKLLGAMIHGQQVVDIGRRGKYILMPLDSGETLIVHLRMTGRLRVEPADSSAVEHPHVRAWFDLEGGKQLVFTDMRKFGRIWLVERSEQVTGKLGPEPLTWDFTPEILTERVRKRRIAVKALLLDQTAIAGLGNIYADEALFVARIHPLRRAASLTDDEIERLYAAIREVLQQAVGKRGTTLRDYQAPYSGKGAYQEELRVYQQTNRPCPRCGTAIQRIRVTQRSTHFCPSCQILPSEDAAKSATGE